MKSLKTFGIYPKKYFWIAIVIYFVATCLFFYPVISSINHSLIGPNEDNQLGFWGLWWTHRVVTEGAGSLMFAHHISYPEGTSLLYQDFSLFNCFFSLLLRKFFDPILTYNVLILQSFITAGMGGFLLIRYLVRNSWSAIIGGYIFAFSPWHFAHALHHLNYSSIEFIPFFILFFIKLLRNEIGQNLAWSCLFNILCSLCSWYFMVFNFYFMCFVYIYMAFTKKQLWIPSIFKKIIVIMGCTIGACLFWILPMMILSFLHPEAYAGGHNIWVADVLAFFIPDSYHFLNYLGPIKWLNSQFTGNSWEAAVYLGIVNLFILGLAFKSIVKETAKYFFGLMAFCILGMGSFLHVGGKAWPVILPYSFLKYLPFFSNARAPSRAVIYAYLFLAILVSFALTHLFRRSRILTIGLIIFIFIDFYAVCRISVPVQLPSCYKVISEDSEQDFAILDLPSGYEENESYMLYQTLHQRPILQGFIARKIGHSLIDRLEVKDLEEQKKQLEKNKVKYIVIHKEFVSLKKPLDIEPYHRTYQSVYKDAGQEVFRVYLFGGKTVTGG